MATPTPPRPDAASNADRILYVTSFGPDIYDATGKNLLESFYARPYGGKMLVCHEGSRQRLGDFRTELKEKFPQAIFHQLDDDPFLTGWLAHNADIIPKHLGGDAEHCDCPGWEERHAKHKWGCHYQWMNRNASRWFRKVVSWRRAAKRGGVDYIVWIDSDCVFSALPSYATLQQLFADRDVLYMRGKREAVESGILGFNMLRQGGRFIQAVSRCYDSGEFRMNPRWDDGYIVTTFVKERPFHNRDLVDRKRQTGNKVDQLTPWAKYVQHHKGSHGRVLGIME